MAATANEINCFHCKNYYVTWDEFFPRGCKALGFKSREMPSAVVRRSSGMECQLFERKKERGKRNE